MQNEPDDIEPHIRDLYEGTGHAGRPKPRAETMPELIRRLQKQEPTEPTGLRRIAGKILKCVRG
jgi:hypothetical protein